VLTYAEARGALAEALLKDAAAHEAERYDEIGRRFDSFEHRFPLGVGPELKKLRIALTFWDGWIDARNLGWQTTRGIQQSEWPQLARAVAADLTADRDITEARIRARFDATAKASLGDRAQILAARLRERSATS
jgi:hypothetical protein